MTARALAIAIAAVAFAGAAAACANVSLGAFDMGAGGGHGAAGVGGGYMNPDIDGGDSGTDYVPPVNNSYRFLCGSNLDTCVPGSPTKACDPIAPPPNTGGSGAGGAGGGYPQGGAGGVGGGMGNDGGGATGGQPQPNAHVSCIIVSTPNGLNDVCAPAGTLKDGDPCESAGDCNVDLGCVKTTSGGVCRPYCCEDIEACGSGTYCSPQRMLEGTVPQPLIPVCTPATNCKLLDDTTCDPGLTCTVVREDGTTSCVEPGSGMRGDPCPCAAGYICSHFTSSCVKLCHTGSDDCGAGVLCQGGNKGFPSDIGICAGYMQ